VPRRASAYLLWLTVFQPLLAAEQSVPEKLIEEGHWKRARPLAEAMVRNQPREALGYFLLSQIHNAFGDRDSPLPLAEKALALDGGTAKYHRQLAEVLGVTAQHAGIVQQVFLARRFKKEIAAALELDANDLQALRDLMEYYLLAPGFVGGDRTRARATAGRISKVSAVAGCLAEARLAALLGDSGKEESLLRKAVEADPANYRARAALGEFYLSPQHANPEAAVQQGRELVRIDRGRVDGYTILARAYASRGAWEDLDFSLAAAAQEVPDDFTPAYRAAEVLLANSRASERAVRYLRSYLASEPEGNAPTLAEAKRKLDSCLLEKRPARGSGDGRVVRPTGQSIIEASWAGTRSPDRSRFCFCTTCATRFGWSNCVPF
jgi:hypothetical protein